MFPELALSLIDSVKKSLVALTHRILLYQKFIFYSQRSKAPHTNSRYSFGISTFSFTLSFPSYMVVVRNKRIDESIGVIEWRNLGFVNNFSFPCCSWTWNIRARLTFTRANKFIGTFFTGFTL